MIRRHLKGITFVLILSGIAYVAMAAAPVINSFTPPTPVNDTAGASRTFSITVSETANITWYINETQFQFNENVTTASYEKSGAAQGTWIVNATATNANGTVIQEWVWIVAAPAPGAPSITNFNPSTPVTDTAGASRTFSIDVNQTVNAIWYINGTPVQNNTGVTTASYTDANATQGTWIVNATVENDNGMDSREWTWMVMAPPPSITASPESPVNDIEGATRSFNITANQDVNVTWYINGTEVKSEIGVTGSNYTNTSAAKGTWIVNVTAANANGADSKEWIWNVKDITPPGNVTDLTAENGQTYINWSWNNPNDTDFDGTGISINGAFKTNLPKTSDNYNATGLAPGTSYTISVIAFDTSGNNATPVENTSTTLPNTPVGTDIIPIGLPSRITVTFSNVTGEGNTTVSSFTPTQVPGFEPLGDYVNINTSAIFTGPVTIALNYPSPSQGFNNNTVSLYLLNNAVWQNVTTNLDIAHNVVTGEVTGQPPFILVAGVYPPPGIKVIQAPPSLDITIKDSLFFNISVDQTANVTWTVNNISQGSSLVQAGGSSSFNFRSTTKGNYSIMVEADNANGTSTQSWNVIVHPRFFFKGNRIWDGSKPDEFSLTYTWDPMSFSGFYYDINDNVGDESITMTLDGYSDRTINRDDLVYTTTPQEVSFGYSGFGRYNVIGFMAEKYFAGYTASSRPPNPTTGIGAKSVLAQGQLHRVLMDDDTRRTITLGSTLTLQEGYVLKAVDIDLGARTMLISLLKDGTEVDRTPLSAGQTYVYTKRVGAVTDLPIILIRFDSVFSGTEVQAAFLRGMFQISESYDTVNTGNDFGMMEVASVSDSKIEMRNNAGISLSRGSTVDLMGDMKILVADDSSTVRFALSVEKTGSFEVRSSIYKQDDPIDEWTPYNFGMNIGKTSFGFYYDLDGGIGTESLRLAEPLDGGRTIKDGNLLYTTTPQEVNFGYSGFGSYEVIGFMADKYFAGYTAGSQPPNPTTGVGAKSVLGQGQLHKVLIDDDTRRTISLGSTLTLQEGYVLKAVDIDLGARTMLISLLKDGTEVDSTPLSAGQTYVYTKRVGAVADLPVIMVRFDSVFSGTEVQAAFLRGVFQISENYAAVSAGNEFGMMEVRGVSNDNIEMSNDGSIGLDNGENEALMGNIRLKVGDTAYNSLRFYFAVDVTPEMVANLLVMDAPAQASAGDTIAIKVTAGGSAVNGASLSIDSSDIGQTDNSGVLNYTIPITFKGIHNITATKLGYITATKSIEILEYVERRLSIDSPATANQFDTIIIRVTSNSTAISGASVKFDNTTIGSTDSNGVLNYTLETSGTHSISASKSGYITVIKDIDVRAPFSQYQALDINITPGVVFTGEKAVIRSNITNAGTKKDTLPVELVINGTAVDNRSVTLAPREIKEVNFTQMEAKAGNYTVEILGQKGLLEVKEKPFTLNLIMIAMIFTGLGVIIIYLLTAKNKISLELIQRKLKAGKKPLQ